MKMGDVEQYYQKQYNELSKTFNVAAFEEACDRASKERKAKELEVLRDHFAGFAMQGLMTAYWDTFDCYENSQALIKCQVETAYEYADAMLKQRSLTNA